MYRIIFYSIMFFFVTAFPNICPTGHTYESKTFKQENTDNLTLILTVEEKIWLEQHPKITIGIMDDWQPIDYVDDQGRPSGIGVDYIMALSKQLGLRFVIEAAPFGVNFEKVKNRELDAIMDISYHKSREPFFNFTHTYIKTSHVFVGRKGSQYIHSATNLAGKTLALETGFYNTLFFKENFSDIKIREYKSTADALDAVSRGEADAYVGNRSVVKKLIKKELLLNLREMATSHHTNSGLRIGVRKDWLLFTTILNKAIKAIPPKQQLLIQQNQLGLVENDVSDFWLSADEKKWFHEHPVIPIGIMSNWPPLSFLDENGQLLGVGVDYIYLLNKRLGGRLVAKPAPFIINYERVKSKEIPAIMEITQSKSREDLFHFTRPYITIPHIIVGRKNGPYFKLVKDLIGKTVALEKGFYNSTYFLENFPQISLREYASTAKALEAVSLGEADAYVGNRAVAMYLIEKKEIPALKLMGKIDELKSTLQIGIRKDWPELASILDRALASITTEEENEILQKWTEKKNALSIELELTNAEKEWLRNHPDMRLGIDPAWQPFEYFDNKGELAGITSDNIRFLKEKMGVTSIEAVKGLSWIEVLEKIKTREIDIVSAIAKNDERAGYMLFTEPYLKLPLVVITREDSPFIEGLKDLNDAIVGVVKGYVTLSYLKRDFPKLKLKEYDSLADAVKAVARGKAAAVISNIASMNYLKNELGLKQLKVAATTGYSYELSVGVRKDWPELVPILEKCFSSMTDLEKEIIKDKWVNLRFRTKTDWKMVLKVVFTLLFICGIIVTVIVFWNRRLTYEISQRKKAMKEVLDERERTEEALANLKVSQKELRKYAETQVVLVQEVNHRVKNNLASVIGMLNMEQDHAEAKGIASYAPLLNDLVKRIEGLASVHSILTASNWQPLEVGELCQKVIEGSLQSVSPGKQINLRLTAGKGLVTSDQAHHLAMVINELTTNTVKYAFGDRQMAEIIVTIKQNEENLEIIFKDDGPGYPDELFRKDYLPSSIGVELIQGIVRQSLNGDVIFRNERGAVTIITFRNEGSDFE